MDEAYKVDANNSMTYKLHVLTKVLSVAGQEKSTIYIPFNSFFQELKVNTARTIQPDGRIVDATLMSEESRYAEQPIYKDIKVKKITFPGVQPGSVMEYEIEIITDCKTLPSSSATTIFPVNEKVQLLRLSIDVPKGQDLKFNVVRVFE